MKKKTHIIQILVMLIVLLTPRLLLAQPVDTPSVGVYPDVPNRWWLPRPEFS